MDRGQQQKNKCKVNKELSIMNVELMAIDTALDVINTKSEDQFVICTDSKSALTSINNSNSKDNFLVHNIIRKLNTGTRS